MEQTERRPLYIALALNVVIAMLTRFLVVLYPNLYMVQSHLFGLMPAMLAVPMLSLPEVRRQRGLYLCASLAVWTAVTCLFPEYVESDLYTVLTPFFLTMALLFIVCYPMAFAVGREYARRVLRFTVASYVFPMTVIAGIGVYAALMGIAIPSPGGAEYMPAQILDHRLSMFLSSVATGSYSCLAVFLCVLRLMDRPRPAVAVPYILCIPVAYAAAALSDARIPIVCVSVCMGGLAWLVAQERLPLRRAGLRMAASFAIAGVVMLLLYGGTSLCIRGTNAVSAAIAARTPQTAALAEPVATEALPAASLQPEAAPAEPAQTAAAATPAAEAPAQPEAAQPTPAQPAPTPNELKKRPLLHQIGTLNGRTDVWLSAIGLFQHDPIKLITGTSPVFIIRDTQPYLSPDAMNDVYPHMHSLPFQTVTALGLPGLLLYAVLIVYISVHALRVFFLGKGRLTLFERGTALIPLFFTVMDVVDVSLWFAPPSSFTSLWFYLTGGYAVYLSTTRIPKKQRTAPAAPHCEKEADA